MKVITLVILGVLLVGGTAEASKRLMKGESFATVGIASDQVTVYRVVDGDTTCYVTKHGTYGAHAISCVK